MLAAQKLGGLAKDDRGTQIHQLVGHIPDHAVGGHAAGGVGSTALDGHDDLRDIHRLPLQTGDLDDQFAGKVGAQLDGLADAAQLLNVDDLHVLAGGRQLPVHPLVVGAFAAEADDQDGTDVGAHAKADEGVGDPLQIRRHLAAPLMMQVGDGALHLMADGVGHIVGAGHTGDHSNIVACADFSVGAHIAHKLHDELLLTCLPWPSHRGRAYCPDCGRVHTRLCGCLGWQCRSLRRIC